MFTRSRILVLLAVLLLLVAGTAWRLTRPLPILTVTTWPGAYGRAQANAMLHPFGEEARVDVHIAEYDGGLDHLREEVSTHRYDWDVVDLEEADAVRACKEGLLAPIDRSSLAAAADGAPASRDFAPNAIGACWVGSVVFAQVIAYAPRAFSTAPRSARDYFDLEHFPGGRGLRGNSAKLNLEFALLADGVAPNAVYPLLSTDAGVRRALAKLSSIRSSIVWWSRPQEAVQALADGRAVMTTALDGDVYDAQVHGLAIATIWDRQLDELDVFGIPAGDPKHESALAFIQFATGTKPLARMAEWVPYGPARHSALSLVGRNPDLGMNMLPFLPTAPANARTVFTVDDAWWMKHGADIAPLWRAWRDQGS